MSKQRRLGRGLEALLSRSVAEGGPQQSAQSFAQDVSDENLFQPESVSTSSNDSGLTWINVYEIDRNPFQPRKHFDPDEIQSLAESLSEHGMLQPVVVRRDGARHQLISGERRWRAATVAGWDKIPAQVWEADDQKMTELAIVENVQRKDLNPLEKAASFQSYLEQYGCTQDDLAARVKLDRSTIANLIRLLELPEAIQQSIRTGDLTQGHARALLPLGDEREQLAFAKRIETESLSVRATEELVQQTIRDADNEPLGVIHKDGTSKAPARVRNEHLASLEQEFRSALGTKVDLRQGARGRGRLVVHFASHEEFERLRGILSDRSSEPRSEAG